MRAAAIVLLVVTALSAGAQPVVFSIAGSDEGATGANGLAVGWSFSRRVTNVTISALLNNGGGYAGGTAYLMKRIGPGTTPEDEIATKQFELPLGFKGQVTLFTELDLPAGDYWLVFVTPREGPFSYVNWIISLPLELHKIPGARYLGTTWGDLYSTGIYVPASQFQPTYNGVGYQMEISGDVDGRDWRRER